MSLVGTGIELARPAEEAQTGEDRIANELRRSFADDFGSIASDYARRQFDVAPTIHIRPGYRFNVIVERDFIIHPRRS